MTGAQGEDISRRGDTPPKGPICPVCGHPGIRIAYGLPGPEMIDSAEAGRIALGGCVVSGIDPDWACTGPEQHVWRSGEEFRAMRSGDEWSG